MDRRQILDQGRKIWMGWTERHSIGVGGILHTYMAVPPNHHSLDVPVNITYQIPMDAIYGPGIEQPDGLPVINVDDIRLAISREL